LSNEEIGHALEGLFAKGNDYLSASRRDRPYDGQPHTDQGERGRQQVYGVTMRDVADCLVIGAFQAAEFDLRAERKTIYEGTIHDLPWDRMDPLAVIQNATCELEKRMGIYPNVPRLRGASPSPGYPKGASRDEREEQE
jgi:hypothetical protein